MTPRLWRSALLLAVTCLPCWTAPGLDGARVQADLDRLHSFSRELRGMEVQMLALNQQVGMKERGFYTADENDAIESLLFRYLVCRDSLWEMVASYRDAPEAPASADLRARAFVLGMNAAIKLSYYSSKLAVIYLDEPAVIAKLNEAHPAYDVPRGTYDLVVQSLTQEDNLRDLEASWQLFVEEAGNPTTALYRLSTTEPDYRELIAENYRLQRIAQAQVQAVLKAKSLVLPDLANWMRHTELADAARSSWRLVDNKLYRAKGVLFENVGHIRDPLAGEAALTKEQIQTVRESLQPGDILLTYSSGYMSNIFLPGKFKHGIVYVGSPGERRQAGLDMRAFAELPETKRQYVEQELTRGELPDGAPAELIESVSEGVIYNSLDRILDGYVYRMVVLRPRLSPEERCQALAKVYTLLGGDYDFGFDFDDASYICCTEVIYRALHGKGGIAFPLTKRLGIPTLSADDIILYARSAGADRFAPILFVDTEGRFRERAEVLLGDRAEARLATVMVAANE